LFTFLIQKDEILAALFYTTVLAVAMRLAVRTIFEKGMVTVISSTTVTLVPFRKYMRLLNSFTMIETDTRLWELLFPLP